MTFAEWWGAQAKQCGAGELTHVVLDKDGAMSLWDLAREAEREWAAKVAEDEGLRLYNDRDCPTQTASLRACRGVAARIREGGGA